MAVLKKEEEISIVFIVFMYADKKAVSRDFIIYFYSPFLDRRMATQPVLATSLSPKRCKRLKMASSFS